MRGLLGLADGMERIVIAIGRAGAWLSVPLILVIMFDVITRKIQWTQQLILNSWLHDYISSTKLQEWEWHLHTVLFLLALGFAYSRNAHVRVDLLREKLPSRTQVWIELIGCLFFLLPYVLVVLYFAWDFVVQAYVSNEVSSAMTGLGRRWIIKSFLLLGLGLALLAGLAMLLRTVAYLLQPQLRDEIKLIMLTEGGTEMGLPKIEEEVAPKSEARLGA
jgi:TRAP-type mannitol/chloroaromatic compound transport system permease small subunit